MTDWQRWFCIPLATRCAICVWFAILSGVFGRVAIAKPTAQSVLPIYALGGERWWNAEPLYDPPPPPMDVYRNPPGFAALFAPLSQLPPKLVGLGWRLFGITLFLVGLRRFLAAVSPVSLSPRAAATFWIVAALLVLPAFNNGQVNLSVAAAALLGTAAVVRRQWWRASTWLMLAVWLKVYPVALAGLIALLAPRRLSWRMPLVLLAFLAWPYAVRDSHYIGEQTEAFWAASQADERSEAPLDRTAKGWTYLVRVTTGHCADRRTVQSVAAIAGLLLAGVVLRARLRGGAAPELHGFTCCLGLLWMVLFGPATESNTYSILAPVGWLVAAPGLPRAARLVAGIGIGLLLVAGFHSIVPNDPDFTLASLQPIGAFLLLGVGVWAVLKTPHAVAAPTRGEYDTPTRSPRV